MEEIQAVEDEYQFLPTQTPTNTNELCEMSSELDVLLKGAKNFNVHVTVLKKLMDLKDRESGYDYMKPPPDSLRFEDAESVDLTVIRRKMEFLKQEIETSHLLGFCLAYNVQRLQKKLTGTNVDPEATDNMISILWEKYNQSKTNEAMLKYEFEEKRKLLRKLRHQLEQTRRDWQDFRLRRSDPETEEEQSLWNDLREDMKTNRDSGGDESEEPSTTSRASSETDSAVQSDEGDDASNPLQAFDRRRERLDHLEEQCFQLVNDLVARHEVDPDASDADEEFESAFHSPLLSANVAYIDEDVLSSDEFEEDEEEAEEEIPLAIMPPDSEAEPNSPSVAELSELSWDTVTVSPPVGASILVPDIHISSLDSGGSEDRSRSTSFSSREGRRREESVAETGEPIVLCRLRRRAVEILISRLREEKNFHETRENEMRVKLAQVQELNDRLHTELRKYVTDHQFVHRLALVGFAVLFVAAVKMFF